MGVVSVDQRLSCIEYIKTAKNLRHRRITSCRQLWRPHKIERPQRTSTSRQSDTGRVAAPTAQLTHLTRPSFSVPPLASSLFLSSSLHLATRRQRHLPPACDVTSGGWRRPGQRRRRNLGALTSLARRTRLRGGGDSVVRHRAVAEREMRERERADSMSVHHYSSDG